VIKARTFLLFDKNAYALLLRAYYTVKGFCLATIGAARFFVCWLRLARFLFLCQRRKYLPRLNGEGVLL